MLKNMQSEGIKSEETTIISTGVKIEGKITSSGNIRVDGEIIGDIFSKSNVTIGERANVNGQINAEAVTIGGKVSGTIVAKQKCVLDSKGDLKGDIITQNLVIESGAKFVGNSKTGDSKDDFEIKETKKPSTPINKVPITAS
ncbi:MAG: polymer-forming cytoskeletal protein [Ignavibacteriaceae bacterium]|jgi:cytoskeletal protein CcmA (bactofilin family)